MHGRSHAVGAGNGHSCLLLGSTTNGSSGSNRFVSMTTDSTRLLYLSGKGIPRHFLTIFVAPPARPGRGHPARIIVERMISGENWSFVQRTDAIGRLSNC